MCLRTLVVRSLVGTKQTALAEWTPAMMSQNLGRQVVGGYINYYMQQGLYRYLSQNLGRQVVGGYTKQSER